MPADKWLAFRGKRLTVAGWSRELGIGKSTLHMRLGAYGWSVARALSTPAKPVRRKLRFRGKLISLAEWSAETGMSPDAFYARLARGWSVARALSTPAKPVKCMLSFRGKVQSMSEWSTELGIAQNTLSNRLARGWSVARTLTAPVGTSARHFIEHNGKRRSLTEWARKLRISPRTIHGRLESGWPVALVLTPLLCHAPAARGVSKIEHDYLRRLARHRGWVGFPELVKQAECVGTDDMRRLRSLVKRGFVCKRTRPSRRVEWCLTARGRRALQKEPLPVLGISSPVHRSQSRNLFTHAGRTQSLGAWGCELGLSRQLLHRRLKQGWPLDRALSPMRCHPGGRGYAKQGLSQRALDALTSLAALGPGWHLATSFASPGADPNARSYLVTSLLHRQAITPERPRAPRYQITPTGRALLRRAQRTGVQFAGLQERDDSRPPGD